MFADSHVDIRAYHIDLEISRESNQTTLFQIFGKRDAMFSWWKFTSKFVMFARMIATNVLNNSMSNQCEVG